MIRHGEATLRHLLAPIQDLLDDPRTTDIVIQRPGEVGSQKHGKWSWRKVDTFDFRVLDAIGITAGKLMSAKFDPAHPICLTHLPGGERLTLIRPPASLNGYISASIAPSARDDHGDLFGFENLMREAENRLDEGLSDIDRELRDLHKAKAWSRFFPLAVTARKTIGATGIKGSGKTTFLRKHLLSKVSPEDRMVTIEDTPEFFPSPDTIPRNCVSLFFGAGGITAEDCVEAFLRMRADRGAFQELRGGEVMGFLKLDASGHSGSFTTWHAHQKDPFTPLVLMAKATPAGRSIPDDKLEMMFRAFIDIVVYCYRHPVTHEFSVPSVIYRGAEQ